VEEEIEFLCIVLVQHGVAELEQEPAHYDGPEYQDEPPRPRLVFVNVFNYVDFSLKNIFERFQVKIVQLQKFESQILKFSQQCQGGQRTPSRKPQIKFSSFPGFFEK
jgi:hypothetical protein